MAKQTNLLKFVESSRNLKNVQTFLDENEIYNLRELLWTHFPNIIIHTACDKLIIDMAELFLSISEDTDKLDYISFLLDSSKNRLKKYDREKQTVENTFKGSTKIPEKQKSFTEAEVQAVLQQLDRRFKYINYDVGYEHDNYLITKWLIDLLEEALDGQTHEIIPASVL